jgi:hypothetical protein
MNADSYKRLYFCQPMRQLGVNLNPELTPSLRMGLNHGIHNWQGFTGKIDQHGVPYFRLFAGLMAMCAFAQDEAPEIVSRDGSGGGARF